MKTACQKNPLLGRRRGLFFARACSIVHICSSVLMWTAAVAVTGGCGSPTAEVSEGSSVAGSRNEGTGVSTAGGQSKVPERAPASLVRPKEKEAFECSQRDETLRLVLESKAKAILDRCTAASGLDLCSLDAACLKQEVHTLFPGETRFFVEISGSNTPSYLSSLASAQSGAAIFSDRQEDTGRSGLRVFAGFRLAIGDSSKSNTRRVCLPPLETAEGKAFVRGLLSALTSVVSLGEDPCGVPENLIN